MPGVLPDPERARLPPHRANVRGGDPGLRALADAIGTPAVPLTGAPADGGDRRVEEAAVAAVDTLLARVARVSATLRAGDAAAPLDPAATRLLLADLALVAGLLRSLNGATADRLASAVADLQQARDEVGRRLAGAAGGGH
jgi:hypothetical protein